MAFLKRLFGGSRAEIKKEIESRSPFLPKDELPIDEKFTINFKKNGGKFLYCENLEELSENFLNILVENDWFESKVFSHESLLSKLIDENKLIPTNKMGSDVRFLLTSCESVIAEDGSILFSSAQIKHYKPSELPFNIIIVATTSQIVPNKSGGLRKIKSKYADSIPTNITSVNNFKTTTPSNDDFLNYGSTCKNLYLLLLENL